MLKAMFSSRVLMGVLLIAVVIGICWAVEVVTVRVSINPYKIVLNAKVDEDVDVQANIPGTGLGASVTGHDVDLFFNDIDVADSESAFYCLIDDMLIIGFDRTELQNNPDVQAMANTTVTATVAGYVMTGVDTKYHFSGTDNTVEIVVPSDDEVSPGARTGQQ